MQVITLCGKISISLSAVNICMHIPDKYRVPTCVRYYMLVLTACSSLAELTALAKKCLHLFVYIAVFAHNAGATPQT